MKLMVQLKEQCYPILIESGILSKAESWISTVFHGKRMMIVSDDMVFPLYGQKLLDTLSSFECHSLILPHGEATKNFQSLPLIYGALLEHHFTRSDLIIALGGGVIGDLAGFAAATYLRGVPLIQIPTSLLAQVDSSVGGKVAVDLPQGKNLAGAFYHPKLVLIDPSVLETLPKRFITDGMGEVIKYGCIRDVAMFDLLAACENFEGLKPHLDEVICRCVDIKREIVENDPCDKGERMLLNFGHTLGHAIEQQYHFTRESHGEAVAIGMYQITRLSELAGLTETGTAVRISSILKSYGLPLSSHTDCKRLTEAMKLDKKNLNNQLHLILLHQIGDAFIHSDSVNFFRKAGEI